MIVPRRVYSTCFPPTKKCVKKTPHSSPRRFVVSMSPPKFALGMAACQISLASLGRFAIWWLGVNRRLLGLEPLCSKKKVMENHEKMIWLRLAPSSFKPTSTLLETTISSFEGTFEDDFPIPKVGYLSSLFSLGFCSRGLGFSCWKLSFPAFVSWNSLTLQGVSSKVAGRS